MDIKSFLESGLLESYALDNCTPAERVQVEQMLAQYPEARAELEAIEQAIERYANTQAVEPPANLKDRIMQEIDRTSVTLTPSVNRAALRLYQAACLLLLAGIGYLVYQNSTVSDRLKESETLRTQLEQRVQNCETNRDSGSVVINVLRKSTTEIITVKNIIETSAAPAYVFQNTETGVCTALLDVNSLPKAPAGKYLQFWALIDGVPTNMGTINPGYAGFQSFACVPNAAGFAVSIENSPTPVQAPTTVYMVGMRT